MKLTLTSPYMGTAFGSVHNYVKSVQQELGVRPVDGVYGPATAGAVKNWKYRYGFHSKFVTTDLTDSEAQWLFGDRTKTPAQKYRASRRAAAAALTPGERATNTMLAWASKHYTESPPYSNKVPELKAYSDRQGIKAWYGNMGWPWCAFSAFLASYAWGSKAALAGFAGKFNVLYVPTILSEAQKGNYGMRVVSFADARKGDLVVFNWNGGVPDHIGRLVSKLDSSKIHTVEGNTSPGASGSQSDGGGVYERIRPMSDVQAFIRES